MSATTTPLGQVLQGVGVMGATPTSGPRDALARLLAEWQQYFARVGVTVTVDPEQLQVLTTAINAFFETPTREQELDLVEKASANPLYGLMMVLAALPGTANRQFQRLWPMLLSAGMPGNTRTFPPAAPGRKYLIISDVHRDAASDRVPGPFKPGSIDHFSDNSALYQRILDFVIDRPEYTLLEGGDCEELWFIRDVAEYPRTPGGTLDIAAKLREIIDSHPLVYQKLVQLHDAGRYFRIYGNHDSFLRPDGSDDSVGTVLRTEMERNGTIFRIYDSFVIEGVKTMTEHGAFGMLGDLALFAAGQIDQKEVAERLVRGRLGLDANDYTEKTRMLITHGHQFDFWNCRENEILGLMIANTVGMFVDRNMDPFLDIGGVALEGNPLFQFDDLFAKWPVFNSWPAKQASKAFAHQVQHMPNAQRELVDSVMYVETLAAYWGAFGIPLDHRMPDGTVVTPQETLASINPLNPLDMVEYLERHHFHHICIGHTHNPQSQPYFTLNTAANLAFPMALPIKAVQALLPEFLEPAFKTMFFNSGTAGWMEGLIWAIEVDETGQARLIYWTDNSLNPEYMDWELQGMDPQARAALLEGVRTAFGEPAAELGQHLKDLQQKLRKRFVDFNISPEALEAALMESVVLPIQTLALSLMKQADQAVRTWVLEEIKTAKRTADELRKQYETLRSFTLDVLLSAKRRSLRALKAVEAPETCVIRAPISAADRKRLKMLQAVFMGLGLSEAQALHAAGHAMAAFDRFPRNLPFFSSVGEPQNPEARLHDSKTPVLQALLSNLWMYPPAGETVLVGQVEMRSRFALEGNHVTLTVTLSTKEGGPGGNV